MSGDSLATYNRKSETMTSDHLTYEAERGTVVEIQSKRGVDRFEDAYVDKDGKLRVMMNGALISSESYVIVREKDERVEPDHGIGMEAAE